VSQATIKIEDNDDDGTVGVHIEFDPPLEKGGKVEHASHYMAARLVEKLGELFGSD
jgi:hypothetical protein